MNDYDFSGKVLACAYKVHSKLGPGLLESAYKQCLVHELRKSGFSVEVEKPVPLVYDELRLSCGYRLDILVDNRLVLEIKCVEMLNPVHKAQLLTYLRIAGFRYGLLLNFFVPHLKEGIQRVANN